MNQTSVSSATLLGKTELALLQWHLSFFKFGSESVWLGRPPIVLAFKYSKNGCTNYSVSLDSIVSLLIITPVRCSSLRAFHGGVL